MLNSKKFVRELQLRHESAWMNPNVGSADAALAALPLTRADVDDAEARLERFAPFIKKVFPETAADRGLIESPLTEIENMRAWQTRCSRRAFRPAGSQALSPPCA